MKNDIFWSEIGSGFEELGSTPPPFPRSTLPFPDGIKACGYYFSSLRHRHNLTLVSNVRKAVRTSLFGAHNGLNKLPKVCFEFLSCYRLTLQKRAHSKTSIVKMQISEK